MCATKKPITPEAFDRENKTEAAAWAIDIRNQFHKVLTAKKKEFKLYGNQNDEKEILTWEEIPFF